MIAAIMRHRLALAAGCALAGSLCALGAWVVWGPNRFEGGTERVLFVSRGESFASVVDSMEAKGILRSRFQFMIVARLMGGADKVHVGKFPFQSGISNVELLRVLRSGKGNELIQVTVPEGAKIRSQARIFSRALGTDSSRFARLAFDPGFASSVGIEGGTLEGYLLPDTYGFSWQQDERDVLKREVESFQKFFNDTLRARCSEYKWDVHKAVTFASIVEGEAVLDAERTIISGVYHNRLRIGMRLDADPTIQYILDGGPRRLTFEDLKYDSPYNTYRNAGLPPGPVNNPGRASILAALYPQGNSFLYFVANGRGGHWFSRTYDEHLHFVRLYQHQRRARAVTGSLSSRG